MTEPQVIAFLVQGAALGLTAATAPGPFQAFLISESLAGGWRRAAPIACAPLISDAPIVLITLLVLKQLPPLLLRGLSLAGGLFVLYLAFGLWKRWRAGAGQVAEADRGRLSAPGILWRAALINALGPGPYLFWTLVNGPILIAALNQSPLHGGAFLIGFYGIMVGALLTLIGLFHQARRLGPRVVRALLLASIVILIVFGGVLIGQGLSG